VALARADLARHPHVAIEQRRLPDELPDGPFGAVIASEILYYLPRAELMATLRQVRARLAPDGVFVTVNMVRCYPDTELGPVALRAALIEGFGPPTHSRIGAGWSLAVFRDRRPAQ
jgi:hypothetical protein